MRNTNFASFKENIKKSRDRYKSSPLAKGFFITLLGSGASKVILMLATFIFTNILSKDDFGSFSFIRNTLNIILCICALNYVGLVTKYTAELKYKAESAARIILVFLFSLVICFFIGIISVFLPNVVINSIIGESSLAEYFRAIGLLLPCFMLQPLIEGVVRGFKLFKLIGILQTTMACLFVVLVVVGILSWGIDGAVCGLLLYYMIYAIISVYVIIKKTQMFDLLKGVRWRVVKAESNIIWTIILPIFLLSFIEAPVNWWAQVLMTKYDTIGAIGSMSAILQIRNLLIIVPNYFFSTFTTFQTTLNAQCNYVKYFSNLKKTFWVCMIIGVIGSIILCVCGQLILSLYGAPYKGDINAFYIAMAAFPMLITISLMKSNLLIKEHQRFMLVMSAVSSLVQIGTMYVLLPVGVPPVSAYFWSQLSYCLVSFILCVYCCLKDKRKINL